MLTKEQNERITRVGAGTPCGELLRRYWWPVAVAGELDAESVIPIKLLGESLVLYRTPRGDLGVMAERCPHRGASMAYGIPEADGLRRPYHGWKFSEEGTCLEMPAEPADSSFKHRVRIPAYPVQEMGGLIWTYLGPEPVPLLPRWDLLVRDDLRREVGVSRLPCNWLQAVENSMDPVHLEYLHGMYLSYVLGRQGKPSHPPRHHLKIAFNVWEYGVSKRRLLEGDDPETSDDWLVGHPVLFPGHLALGSDEAPRFEFRVPLDDQNVMIYSYFTFKRKPGEDEQPVRHYEIPYKNSDGSLIVDTVLGQDMMAWATQGAINDRTTERLGTSDKGIILYRALLLDQIEKVQRGEDPMGIVRDPAQHTPYLTVPREHLAFFTHVAGLAAQPEEMQVDPLALIRRKQ